MSESINCMAKIEPIKFNLKNSKSIIIRTPVETDAEQILAVSKAVIGEEIFQLTSSEEFNLTVADEVKWINSHSEKPNAIIFIAEIENKIIGLLDFSSGHRRRIAHTGEFGMSVLKEYRGLGVGTALLTSLVDWAQKHDKIEKINLMVHSTNTTAIAAYKKMGFAVEGVRQKDLKYSASEYVDTVLMGKFVK